MSLIVEKKHFDGLSGALEEIRKKGLFPTTYATDHATAANLHWHSEDVLAYMIQGKTHFWMLTDKSIDSKLVTW